MMKDVFLPRIIFHLQWPFSVSPKLLVLEPNSHKISTKVSSKIVEKIDSFASEVSYIC